ncbi:MAG TPA: hypothetical protein VEW42_06060 [Candidatus Eisenbacteria bacterium]|nr:hypothetical protein [Candidatus Eisenbacteria bacterium]
MSKEKPKWIKMPQLPVGEWGEEKDGPGMKLFRGRLKADAKAHGKDLPGSINRLLAPFSIGVEKNPNENN